MKKQEKVYKIKMSGRTERIVEGTLNELTKYFGYTLECGASWNEKIKRYPKTIKSFIINLQKSYGETEASCYKRTFVSLVEEKEIV